MIVQRPILCHSMFDSRRRLAGCKPVKTGAGLRFKPIYFEPGGAAGHTPGGPLNWRDVHGRLRDACHSPLSGGYHSHRPGQNNELTGFPRPHRRDG